MNMQMISFLIHRITYLKVTHTVESLIAFITLHSFRWFRLSKYKFRRWLGILEPRKTIFLPDST